MYFRRLLGGLMALITVCLGGCSLNRVAIKAVSNALTGEGSTSVFTGDSDPALVGGALPFAIKLYETLLAQNPRHPGLLLTTGSLLVMYANAFVQGPADMLGRDFFEERDAEYSRAKGLYLRGTAILGRALEQRFPGFAAAFAADPEDGILEAFLSRAKKGDVPLLYWTVAGTLAAYSLDPLDLDLGMKVPALKILIDRAYALDPDFNRGAIDDFYVLFYASLPEGLGGDRELAELHFRRAVEKSRGLAAGPYVSYAQAVSIPAQDYRTFREALEAALKIDPEADPDNRLVNVIAQRKARYLLDNARQLFIVYEN